MSGGVIDPRQFVRLIQVKAAVGAHADTGSAALSPPIGFSEQRARGSINDLVDGIVITDRGGHDGMPTLSGRGDLNMHMAEALKQGCRTISRFSPSW